MSEFPIPLAVLSGSILLQFAAAGLAVRLIWVTGDKRAWSLIALAIVLMAVRRCITFFRVVSEDISLSPDLAAELVALTISVLMFVGVAWIAPLFVNMTKAHAAVKESGERFRNLIEGSTQGIFIHREFKPLFVNRAGARIFGYDTPEQVLDLDSVLDLVVPAERTRMKELRETRMRGEEIPKAYEIECRRRDGSSFWVEHRGRIVNWDGEGAAQSIVVDISDRKSAEFAIKESEERYRSLVESSNVIAWKLDVSTWRFSYVSPQAVNMLGYPIEDWYGDNFWAEHIHPDDRNEAVAYCQAATARGEDHSFEYRMVSANGRNIWLSDIVTVHEDGGEATSLSGLMIDITARKHAEEALKESEARFKDYADTAADWFWEMGPDLRFTYHSDRYFEIAGIRQEDNLGTTRTRYLDPSQFMLDKKKWDVLLADLESRRYFKNFEFDFESPDGTVRAVRISGKPILDAHGAFQGFRGTGTDIADRKRTEEALRESESLLNSIVENIPVGILIKDTNHVVERANSTYLNWYGSNAKDMLGRRSDEVEGFQSDEDATLMNKQEKEVSIKGLTQTRQVQRPFVDGQTHTVSITKFPVYDQQGNITKVGSS